MKCDNSFFLHHDHLFPPHRFMLPLITFIRQASNGFLCPAFSQSNRTGQYKLPPTCVRGEKKRKETRSVQMIRGASYTISVTSKLYFFFSFSSSPPAADIFSFLSAVSQLSFHHFISRASLCTMRCRSSPTPDASVSTI